MKKRTEGAWIIHHTKKIQNVTQATDFEDIEVAGKCGLFLSNLAASNENSTLNKAQVDAIARASSIKKVELVTLKETLKNSKLIDTSQDGSVSVLGITTSNVLDHTADIFEESNTSNFQKAALELTNYTSDKPVQESHLKEYISDTYKLGNSQSDSLFNQVEDIGLIDYEDFNNEKLYFNGNLFKKDVLGKTNKVLSTLSSEEVRKITDLDTLLVSDGCVTLGTATKILGETLLSKMHSIAMYDFNEVSNSKHSKVFLTKPSSFSKFGNPFEEDALDLAKAFIASLMYGMKISTSGRGKIKGYQMLEYTLKKLLRGEKVGPCTAIGQDYQVLEMKRVVKLDKSETYPGRYFMRLLKFDIGQLALEVFQKGDITEQTTLETDVTSSSVSIYNGPEKTRMKTRRKKDTSKSLNIGELLKTMRN